MKTIEAYLDVVSPYSYHALTYLLTHRSLLSRHSVQVKFIPVFLPSIIQGSGNSPPWKIPSKAIYMGFDTIRAQRYFIKNNADGVGASLYGRDNSGNGEVKTYNPPDFFPLPSMTPMRILTYLQSNFPQEIYESTFLSFFYHVWAAQPQLNLSKQENIIHALRHTFIPTSGTFIIPETTSFIQTSTNKRAFTDSQIEQIIKESNSKEIKDKLKSTTDACISTMGAYGCPWFWVINPDRSSPSQSQGQGDENKKEDMFSKRLPRQDTPSGGEPFFGSDRWSYMFDYLDVPFVDIKILGSSDRSAGVTSRL